MAGYPWEANGEIFQPLLQSVDDVILLVVWRRVDQGNLGVYREARLLTKEVDSDLVEGLRRVVHVEG